MATVCVCICVICLCGCAPVLYAYKRVHMCCMLMSEFTFAVCLRMCACVDAPVSYVCVCAPVLYTYACGGTCVVCLGVCVCVYLCYTPLQVDTPVLYAYMCGCTHRYNVETRACIDWIFFYISPPISKEGFLTEPRPCHLSYTV